MKKKSEKPAVLKDRYGLVCDHLFADGMTRSSRESSAAAAALKAMWDKGHLMTWGSEDSNGVMMECAKCSKTARVEKLGTTFVLKGEATEVNCHGA